MPDMPPSPRNAALLADRYRADGKAIIAMSPAQRSAQAVLHDAIRVGELNTERVPACPLCAEQRQPIIAEKESSGEPHPTACCPSCGLVYAIRRFDQTSMAAFYRSHYRYVFDDTHCTVENRFAEARAKYAGRVDRAIRFLNLNPSKDVIVEVGCGGGWNLAPYFDRGFRVIGFDYDENYLSQGRALGLELYNLAEVRLEDKVRDAALIIASEVLEHTTDPVSFLARLNPLLKPRGFLYLTVPSLWEIPFGYASGDFLGELQLAHLLLFDPNTMESALAKAGFKTHTRRTDLRIFAVRDGKANSQNLPNPRNYRGNMRRLAFAEKIGRHFWGWIYTDVCKKNYGKYHTVSRFLSMCASPQRLWSFLDRRFRTGL